MKIGINIFVFLCTFFAFSKIQANKTDSLINLLNETNSDSLRAKYLYNIGDHFLFSNHYKALEFYKKSKNIFEAINDTNIIAKAYLGIGDAYSLLGEYRHAINYFNLAKQYCKKNMNLLSQCHSCLAIEYEVLEDNKKSMDHYYKALEYSILTNDSLRIGNCYHNIGYQNLVEDHIDSAMIYLNKAKLYCTNDNWNLNAYLNSSLGYAERLKNNYNKSLTLHKKALKLFEQNKFDYEIAFELNSIAKTFIKAELPDSALHYLFKSIKIAKSLKNHHLLIKTYPLIYKIYEKKNDFKNAYYYSIKNKAHMDSLNQKNKESSLNSVKSKNKIKQQHTKIQQTKILNAQLSKQRTILIVFSAGILLLLICLFFIFKSKQKEHKKNIELVDKLNNANQSLNKILTIVGHDLRHSVGNLKNLTYLINYNLLNNVSTKNMIKRFIPMVESTHNLLENLLIWSTNNNIGFAPKLEPLNTQEIIETSVLHTNQLAKNKNILIKENVEKIDFIADKNMILTVLRNLVTNAIKFSEIDTCIFINVKKNNNMIEFIVQDQGIGLEDSEIKMILDSDQPFNTNGTLGERGSGLGLSLCMSFIEKHNGQLNIESKHQEGSKFIFSLPLKSA